MKPHSRFGFSLIEIAIALGVVAFCIVAILGLLPTMLNSVRDSHEKAVISHIYQSVAEDLQDNPPADGETARTYQFDYEGFLVSSGESAYTAAASNTFGVFLPSHASNASLIQSQITVASIDRRMTNLLMRPVWIVSDKRP